MGICVFKGVGWLLLGISVIPVLSEILIEGIEDEVVELDAIELEDNDLPFEDEVNEFVTILLVDPLKLKVLLLL